MTERAPLIDPRAAAGIAADVKKRLTAWVPEWKADQDRLGTALVSIFARFAELVIERLNQAPDKSFLAFLDLLGAARLPPQPARAPLTFMLAEGATVDVAVPAGTQVGAEPSAGEQQPVLFETEHDLVVTSVRLQSLFVRDPGNDKYADRSDLLTAEWSGEVAAFEGETAIEHCFYLGHPTLLACTAISDLQLAFELATPGDSLSLQWEIWDGKAWIGRTPEDGTASLSKDGIVVFRNPPVFPECALPFLATSRPNRWLRCRLKEPIAPATRLPEIRKVMLTVVSTPAALRPDAAASNALPLDLGKEFFPFGEKPRLGDSFYLAHREAFSQAGAKVTLSLVTSDPKTYVQEIPKDRSKPPTLAWEYWNGQAWATLASIKDDSESFTKTKSPTVEFTVPDSIQPAVINGMENYWIRARISQGSYGKDSEFGPELKDGQLVKADGQVQYRFSPSTLVPPQLVGLTVHYTWTAKPEVIVTVNDFIHEQKAANGFKPFRAAEADPALYLGFSLPEGRTAFPNRPLSLYFPVAETEYQYRSNSVTPASSTAPKLAWEYWNGKTRTWVATPVYDETESLAHSGLVIWLAPAGIAPRADFGLTERYWLRVRLAGGAYPNPPRIRRLLLNTVMATQTMTLTNEVLGSSDGGKGQRFRTNHAPVLPGQQLEVEEAEMPATAELEEIRKAEGAEAICASEAATARRAVWVRWHEVPDFYASEPRDRYYVLDHLNGEVRFGDGQNGLIPPRGVGNIRLARYQTGGGAKGNVPASALSQLKTTIPYVDQVTNLEPALGGADAESEEVLRARTPRQLRHGGRAVTRDDYHDLALLASPEVARARCVPLWNPAELSLFDPGNKEHWQPGHVTLVIVPRATGAEPKPSLELIRRVEAFLDEHRLPGVQLHVIGPQYLRINVAVEIVPASLEAATYVQSAVENALTRFLHPVTGGMDGTGWPWGREPSQAALYKAIHAISGVGRVSTLEVTRKRAPDIVGLEKAPYFLVCSGQHAISLRPT